MCSRVSASDGLPGVCVEDGLTALECLEAGYMANASPLSTSADASAPQPGSSSANGNYNTSGGGGGGGGVAHWLERAARAARADACLSGALEATLEAQGSRQAVDCTELIKAVESDQAALDAMEAAELASEAMREDPTRHYTPNLQGHQEDGWVMAMCAKCIGRPETMVSK